MPRSRTPEGDQPTARLAPRVVSRAAPRVALVLGGGGLKGFAHIGVLRALRERGIRPAVVAGSSIGALLGAAHAGGVHEEDMAARARALRRRDLFRINHYGMLVDRMRSASLYLPEPLRALVDSVVPDCDFDGLRTPLLVNTVDVALGTQVVWGLPGLRDVPIRDAVYASCALPGFFPPGRVDGRVCVDGGTIDNLPVSIAARHGGAPPVDAVIAVDVGNADLSPDATIHAQGFASIFMRSASVMMQALQAPPLAHWEGPPMLLVRPRVNHIGWFVFGRAEELIAEGYRAAKEALRGLDALLTAPGGIFPRRTVRVAVDRGRCTGCGLCVALAPRVMALAPDGKAFALSHEFSWSAADGGFVRSCPTAAIRTEVLDASPALAATPVVLPPAVVPASATPGLAEVRAAEPADAVLGGQVDVPPAA
ncbi:patatin-like phospholipase family protein [Roseisolibacter sp. H3M3-2]|uniref:patatin-like phospholipase family protein n=1 Tax=Roseisolibacter sp. H3M3-2 TaxID=3031323 RepID=UPI0023DC6F20|nr:patatin-like phospholipase family protein [Roseisolibacter sp. H3M3-2]MDF1501740.1 patatin-like phospholipase family protein [Roseisolibacter sp. H3M3-2]